MISSPLLCPAQKIYQNREIQDLFGRYPHHEIVYLFIFGRGPTARISFYK